MNIPLFRATSWNPQLNRLMDQGKIEDYKGDEVTRLSELVRVTPGKP